MRRGLGLVLVLVAGCRGDVSRTAAKRGSGSGSAAPPVMLAPMPIAFGDCEDGMDALFSSGRQPQDTSTLEEGVIGKSSPEAGNTPLHDAGSGAGVATEAQTPSFTYQADAGYTPGGASALKGVKALLAECLRAAPVAAGVATVDLTYDLDGNATGAVASGIADAKTTTCLATAATQAHRLESTAPAQRCPFAYGELKLVKLPALELSPTMLVLAGNVLRPGAPDDESVAAVVKAGALQRASAITTRKTPPIAIDGPLVVRATADLQMTRLLPVLRSLEAADTSYVLAALRGTEWKLLARMELPLPPILLGTGKAFTRAKVVRHAYAGQLDVFLSIYVTHDQIYVGLSQVNEVRAIPRTPTTPGALASALVGMKASRYLQNRTDIDIAGAPGVTYGEVVPAIDAAIRAGFTDWSLAAPDELATHFEH